MFDRDQTLSAAAIRYLLVLKELDRSDAGVRSVEVAERLKITKPSVHTMIKSLCRKNYVIKEKYEAVHLTAAGRELAGRYSECFDLLCGAMPDSLKLPREDCRNAVCAILAETPESELTALAERLRKDPCEGCSRACKEA